MTMAGILMMKTVLLPGLYRKRLIQKLLVEILLYVVDKDHCFALVIKLRTACSPHHLQHVYTHTQLHTTFRAERLRSVNAVCSERQ